MLNWRNIFARLKLPHDAVTEMIIHRWMWLKRASDDISSADLGAAIDARAREEAAAQERERVWKIMREHCHHKIGCKCDSEQEICCFAGCPLLAGKGE